MLGGFAKQNEVAWKLGNYKTKNLTN